jgi:hypothetical protein
MAHSRVRLAIGVVALFGASSAASAQPGYMSSGSSTGGSEVVGDSGTLIVDVLPLQAEVRLDGARLGTAHDLVGAAIPVLAGDHVVEVTANGHVTTVVSVSNISDWATRVHVQLVPERHP